MTKYVGTCRTAAIVCKMPEFWAWLEHIGSQEPGTVNEQWATDIVRKSCDITSRRELDTDMEAAGHFVHKINRPFQEWRQERRNHNQERKKHERYPSGNPRQ